MSVTGCSRLLTGDNAQPLMFSLRAGRIPIAARQHWFENSTRSFTFFFFPRICCLSASVSRYGFPTLLSCLFFPLPHSPSCCLVVILALAICFTVRHRQRWREAGRETERKRAELKKGNNNDACSFQCWCSGALGRVPGWLCGHLKAMLWCFWKHDRIFSSANIYMKRKEQFLISS